MTTVDEQARRYLRLFPGWVRSDRGEEAIGLVLDQLPSGVDHLPRRARMELIRSGLHARRRWTPPLRVWIEATSADPRNRRGLVPEPWGPWIVQWVHDPRWQRRFVVARMATFAAAVMVLWPAWLLSTERLVSSMVNVSAGALVWGFLQHRRASRWRWAVSLRNGLVPWDLRPLPTDATRQGFVRPWLPNVAAMVLAVGTAVGAALLVVVNLAITGLVPPAERGPAELSVAVVVFAAYVLLLLALLLPPVLRRISRAAQDEPLLPDGPELVAPLQSVASRTISMLAMAMGAALLCWVWAFAGTVGAVAFAAVALGAAAQSVAVLRRQRQTGRTLGLWEVWPSTGPQPILLVRSDMLAAEGLGGPAARGSRLPEGLA